MAFSLIIDELMQFDSKHRISTRFVSIINIVTRLDKRSPDSTAGTEQYDRHRTSPLYLRRLGTRSPGVVDCTLLFRSVGIRSRHLTHSNRECRHLQYRDDPTLRPDRSAAILRIKRECNISGSLSPLKPIFRSGGDACDLA